MRDLNQVILIGRLTKNPEIKYTAGGTPVTKFTLANNGGSFNQGNEKKEVVNFFDVTVWGNHALNCEKYLKKGSLVAIDGHLRQNRWTDQATGKSLSKVEVVANGVQFLTPASHNSNDTSQQGNQFVSKDQNIQSKPQNFNNNSSPKEQKGFISSPWDDTGSNFENYDDPFNNNSNSDDDIPF